MRTIHRFRSNGKRTVPFLLATAACLVILLATCSVFERSREHDYSDSNDITKSNRYWEKLSAIEMPTPSKISIFATRSLQTTESDILLASNSSMTTFPNSASDMELLDNGEDENLAVVVSFEEILRLTVFIATAWLLSNVCVAIGLPGLVGEIVTGFLLGPPLANFCPFPEAMVLIGNFGLIGLMLESGIHLDVVQLRETGTRAVMIAVIGTLLALLSGLGLGYALTSDEGIGFSSAMAIGACFAPSSLGVAAAVLSAGEVLNTPTGQLIVASSVVDDVLGLILLAILNVFVMDDPTAFNFIQPFLASFGFLIVLGYLGIRWIPYIIKDRILPKIPEAQREKATFAIMFLLLLIYLPVLNYSGASYLTGAFLAGLSVSQLPSIHTSYARNGRELMVWLMRIFFAATIGFQVPILKYSDSNILKWSAVLCKLYCS
jgi:Kef-type K+ transport system membrane component KefB